MGKKIRRTISVNEDSYNKLMTSTYFGQPSAIIRKMIDSVADLLDKEPSKVALFANGCGSLTLEVVHEPDEQNKD